MNFYFHDFRPALADFKTEVLGGLRLEQKTIPPKFFYDERGSELFEQITETAEYYPTKTELGIIETACREIAEVVGEHGLLIELGSGSSKKIRRLLNCLNPEIYMPIDISGDHLRKQSEELAEDFPNIEIHAICADYTQHLELPTVGKGLRRAAFYPGSSIGNFDPRHASEILAEVASMLGKDGILLVGVDLQKDHKTLNSAYNDAAGVTAAFNQNLLNRINLEIGADFDLDSFQHLAEYNKDKGRIEMHLVSGETQIVQVDGMQVEFSDGESIHTENSYKYTLEGFANLAQQSGFTVDHVWQDANGYFSVQALRVV